MPRCGQSEEAREQSEGSGLEGGHVIDPKVTVHLGGTRTKLCVCARTRAHVCMRACMCMCKHMHNMCMHMHMHMHMCM